MNVLFTNEPVYIKVECPYCLDKIDKIHRDENKTISKRGEDGLMTNSNVVLDLKDIFDLELPTILSNNKADEKNKIQR